MIELRQNSICQSVTKYFIVYLSYVKGKLWITRLEYNSQFPIYNLQFPIKTQFNNIQLKIYSLKIH